MHDQEVTFGRCTDLPAVAVVHVVPHKDMPQVEASGLAWETVRRDHRFRYVVVPSKTCTVKVSGPGWMPSGKVKVVVALLGGSKNPVHPSALQV